jgi:glycosyltransferase involved in cell wall biosynthesis
MKLLFITRKYPPMVGGMEKLSFALAKEFSGLADTSLITWGKSQKYLPFIYPLFLIKAIYLISTKRIDHIHIGDALLSPLGLILKYLFRIKTTITVVGLDITFNFPGYQFLIPNSVKRLDKVICISNATMQECIRRGIPKNICEVIPCGVYPEDWNIMTTQKDLEEIVGISLNGKKVIITVGRLVERKGVYWFIKNVLPELNRNIIYLVIGDGPERNKIKSLINKLNLDHKVYLLGKISDGDLKIIYNTADLFIMPNIRVKDTIEGFGIVAIEASSTGLPVIASEIEGIKEAITNERNGVFLKPNSKKMWVEKVNYLILNNIFNKALVKDWTINKYNWNTIALKYLSKFNSQ